MAYAKITGIYKITCTSSRKVYVGSAVSMRQRWACHRSMLRRGKHSNKHLQNAWEKYGGEVFEFCELELCREDELIEREQAWIDKFDASNPLVGMNNSPTAATSIGFRHSEATKARLSALAKARGAPHLLAYAKSMAGQPAPNKGKPGKKWTPEMKSAASASRKGRSAWNKGVAQSDESRAKISAGLIRAKAHVKFDDEKIAEVRRLRAAGLSYPKLSKMTGVSTAQAHRMCTGALARLSSIA